ncbi:MAG: MiaB/RimO family radical SAM methylthiotransferase, partial [Clostridia bacterium]
ELMEELTEADCIVGTNDYDKIGEIVDKTLSNNTENKREFYCTCNSTDILVGKRVLTTPSHYAYLRIADGCDNFCSYCLIPFIRGRYRSRRIEDIVNEAKALVENGVKEIILVAQDVTRYGADLYHEIKLVELLKQLSAISELVWIRLLYCYPEIVTDELLNEISNNAKITKYIDIPLQHIDKDMLRLMNRRSTSESIVALFEKLSNNYPQIAVRSTFICGFPGENKETLSEIENFLIRYQLRNVGFFAYSREEGTSADKLPLQVTEHQKQIAVKKMYDIQQKIAFAHNKQEIGKTYKTLIDEQLELDNGSLLYIGRTEYMSPDIDNVVYVSSDIPLQIGNFVDVKITDYNEYDLIGEKV